MEYVSCVGINIKPVPGPIKATPASEGKVRTEVKRTIASV
jgi:hypothetical protein